MFATQIFSSDLNIYNNYIINDKKINNNIKDIFKESFKIKNIIKDIVINNNDNFQISKYNFYSLSNIFYLDPFSIYPNDTYMLLSIYQAIKENISIPLYIFQNEKFQKIFEYYTIYQFLKNNNYSDKELIQIIQYFNINPKLIQKHENQILNYIIFDDLKKDYQDFDLQDFLIYNEIKEN